MGPGHYPLAGTRPLSTGWDQTTVHWLAPDRCPLAGTTRPLSTGWDQTTVHWLAPDHCPLAGTTRPLSTGWHQTALRKYCNDIVWRVCIILVAHVMLLILSTEKLTVFHLHVTDSASYLQGAPGDGKSWNLGRPFSRPGKSWKIAKVMESHGK